MAVALPGNGQGATLLSSAQLVLKSLAFFPFNNSRLLVLPGCDSPNLISRFMKLMLAQLSGDWERRWGHPLALVESFVDPRFYQGTAYKVSGWSVTRLQALIFAKAPNVLDL